jgi:hypothetical protein
LGTGSQGADGQTAYGDKDAEMKEKAVLHENHCKWFPQIYELRPRATANERKTKAAGE